MIGQGEPSGDMVEMPALHALCYAGSIQFKVQGCEGAPQPERPERLAADSKLRVFSTITTTLTPAQAAGTPIPHTSYLPITVRFGTYCNWRMCGEATVADRDKRSEYSLTKVRSRFLSLDEACTLWRWSEVYRTTDLKSLHHVDLSATTANLPCRGIAR